MREKGISELTVIMSRLARDNTREQECLCQRQLQNSSTYQAGNEIEQEQNFILETQSDKSEEHISIQPHHMQQVCLRNHINMTKPAKEVSWWTRWNSSRRLFLSIGYRNRKRNRLPQISFLIFSYKSA
jgi:hypothetical protein